MMHFTRFITVFALTMLIAGCGAAQAPPAGQTTGRMFSASPAAPVHAITRPAEDAQTVRCVVIGGMMETGFWPALAERFEHDTGIHVDVVASGNKTEVGPVFATGKADLITMHASDAIINLVADGYAMDPQPWARNDMIIVGPPEDPAKVKGLTDAAEALRRIARSKSAFVVHSSLGAQEVLRAILDAEGIELDPDHTTVLFNSHSRQVIQIAADAHAYTLCGRIPFLDHKLPSDGMVAMVQGDQRLRRPFLVAIADPARFPTAHVAAARALWAYLKSPQTQQWIATFGRGRFDDRPLFFPLQSHDESGGPSSQPASRPTATAGAAG